jgi:hypothetical protein
MTRPATNVINRLAVFTTGTALLALGAAIILWPTGLFNLPEVVSIARLVDVSHRSWWSSVLGLSGIALTLVALAWLRAQLPRRNAALLRVSQPGEAATITVNLNSVADAAATTLASHDDVRTAQGKAISDCGTRTIVLTATLRHPRARNAVIEAITETCSQIAASTGDPTLAVRTVLRFPKSVTTRTRVE